MQITTFYLMYTEISIADTSAYSKFIRQLDFVLIFQTLI